MNYKTRNRRKHLIESKETLGVASLYFYLGHYSGMRYSVNNMRSLNANPREEPDEMRLLIEELPIEGGALRLGADPEPAMLRIAELMPQCRRKT